MLGGGGVDLLLRVGAWVGHATEFLHDAGGRGSARDEMLA